MKSASIVAGLLASVALAQPHNRHRHQHQKKDVVVEWITEWETVTEVIDENYTSTIFPEHSSTSVAAEPTTPTAAATPSSSSAESAGQFYEASTPSPTPSPSTPTTVQQVVVPSSSSSPAPVEVPSSTYVAPAPAVTTSASPVYSAETPTTYSAAPASTSSASSGGSGSQFTGDLTYYTLGPTACGDDFTGEDSSEAVVALPYGLMGTASSYGPGQPANEYCGKTITITANGKSATATVHDKCMGCEGHAIDVSEKVFLELFGSTDGGRETVSWSFN